MATVYTGGVDHADRSSSPVAGEDRIGSVVATVS